MSIATWIGAVWLVGAVAALIAVGIASIRHGSLILDFRAVDPQTGREVRLRPGASVVIGLVGVALWPLTILAIVTGQMTLDAGEDP